MTSNTEILLELEMYMQRYRDALGEIANCGDQANAVYLREIAKTALDGEPTTADEFNKVQDHGPPYSMANTSGEPVQILSYPDHKYTKKGIQDDPEC